MNTIQFLRYYLTFILIYLFVHITNAQVASSVIDTSKKHVDFSEVMPEFPGGQTAMMKFIASHMKYPKKARKKDTQGIVVIQFLITETGKVTDVKVLRGIGHGCDEEAIRVVSIMPDWTPAMQDGKAVPINFTMPIKFRLE